MTSPTATPRYSSSGDILAGVRDPWGDVPAPKASGWPRPQVEPRSGRKGPREHAEHMRGRVRRSRRFSLPQGNKKSRRRPTLTRASPALPSAMERLTSVFGMGTGVTTPLWPPAKNRLKTLLFFELSSFRVFELPFRRFEKSINRKIEK